MCLKLEKEFNLKRRKHNKIKNKKRGETHQSIGQRGEHLQKKSGSNESRLMQGIANTCPTEIVFGLPLPLTPQPSPSVSAQIRTQRHENKLMGPFASVLQTPNVLNTTSKTSPVREKGKHVVRRTQYYGPEGRTGAGSAGGRLRPSR